MDLRANYFAQARWFFGVLIGLRLISLVRTYALEARFRRETGLVFHLGFIVATTAAAVFPNEAFHKMAAVLAAIAVFA